MGAYETWREAKARRDNATEKQEAELFAEIVESMRSAALLDYLDEHCRRFDSERYDPTDRADAQDVAEFLAGLDELREPNTQAAKELYFNPAIGRLSQLKRMNWTGDNTYGEALDDAIEVLLALWEGKPFPKLERFRCPSIWKHSRDFVQCTLQLPHEGAHKAGTLAWPDEQSVNPPKNYDAEVPGSLACNAEHEGLVCTLPARHSGQHFDARDQEYWGLKSGGVVAAPVTPPLPRCRSLGGAERCDLNEAHDGKHVHRFPSGSTTNWSDSSATGVFVSGTELNKLAGEVFGAEGNSDPINRPAARCLFLHPGDGSIQCWLNHGHDGEHANATWRWAR